MTPDQAATVSAEMSAQRSQELDGDEAKYRMRKACAERAMDLYGQLAIARTACAALELYGYDTNLKEIDQLLKEIYDAQQA